MASEATSEGLKIENFLGGHAPRPPRMCSMQARSTLPQLYAYLPLYFFSLGKPLNYIHVNIMYSSRVIALPSVEYSG